MKIKGFEEKDWSEKECQNLKEYEQRQDANRTRKRTKIED